MYMHVYSGNQHTSTKQPYYLCYFKKQKLLGKQQNQEVGPKKCVLYMESRKVVLMNLSEDRKETQTSRMDLWTQWEKERMDESREER